MTRRRHPPSPHTTSGTPPATAPPEPPPPAPRARWALRTWLLSAAGIVLVGAAAIAVLLANLEPTPRESDGRMGAGWEIQGTVRVAPELAPRVGPQDTLFLIARDEQGALFAVTRVLGPRFPLRYRIGPENVMMPGTPLPEGLRLSGRLSNSGTAGPAGPGDLEGEHAGTVSPGAGEADIVLTRLR